MEMVVYKLSTESSGIIVRLEDSCVIIVWNAISHVACHTQIACEVAFRLRNELNTSTTIRDTLGSSIIRPLLFVLYDSAIVGYIGVEQIRMFTILGNINYKFESMIIALKTLPIRNGIMANESAVLNSIRFKTRPINKLLFINQDPLIIHEIYGDIIEEGEWIYRLNEMLNESQSDDYIRGWRELMNGNSRNVLEILSPLAVNDPVSKLICDCCSSDEIQINPLPQVKAYYPNDKEGIILKM
eukprot:NODE_233_length_3186_cov_36.155403_g203_i0.p1 GENE.NODE_233_length_3186_cov_36.155403_g203_i0~~NODE_233_length_3186_cov_36.155403_g203_i0.p1  ORF type:complete len:242 (-),score=33.23 NODE_233_length_3186_cov_36.155403_g203_i0:335-1060(-)